MSGPFVADASRQDDSVSNYKRGDTYAGTVSTQAGTTGSHYPTDSLKMDSFESQQDQSSDSQMIPSPTLNVDAPPAYADHPQQDSAEEYEFTSTYQPQSLLPPVEVVAESPVVCRNYVLPSDAIKKTLTREVEVPMVEERVIYKSIKQQVARPLDVPKYVTKTIKQEVVQFKEVVTDEVVEVPKPYRVEQRVPIPNYLDAELLTCVSQTMVPKLRNETEVKEVESVVYEPEFHVHDVFIPQVIGGNLVVKDDLARYKRLDKVSPALWNALLLKLNPHMNNSANCHHLPLIPNDDGSITSYHPHETCAVPVGYVNQQEREVLPQQPTQQSVPQPQQQPETTIQYREIGDYLPGAPYREIGEYLPQAIPLVQMRRGERIEGTSDRPLCSMPGYPGFDAVPENVSQPGVEETLNGPAELLPYEPIPFAHKCEEDTASTCSDEESSVAPQRRQFRCCGCGQ